ncbi:CrcB family protein [Micrococcus porci]|uniref:CrcB family protein n=1 Tax=Micrococcus TaxID=1269 RepID=UPI001CC97FDB|nr:MULTISPECIES: CrcB family protein [Micrococcus]MCG7421782.1 CrcB family protein [Micrococcus sp. ACRRV]UBH24275.1 CrcB family protein [Micrococcus porci]
MSAGTVLLTVLLAGLAAAVGAGLRHLADHRWGGRGVLLANVTASALAGALFAIGFGPGSADPEGPAGAALALGAAGAFVLALGTWSTVAFQAAQEVLAGRTRRAVRVWLVHLASGTAAAVVGVLAVGFLVR